MTRVFKYELPIGDFVEITMPMHAKVISVANQNEKLVLYAEVNPARDLVRRRFRIAGTGHDLGKDEAGPKFNFIGTVLLERGQFVLHVYEL